MKNRRGFTLIEVMAAVLILTSIFLVSFPVLTNTLKNNKEIREEKQKENVILAAKTYINMYKDEFSFFTGNILSIDVLKMVEEDLIDDDYGYKYVDCKVKEDNKLECNLSDTYKISVHLSKGLTPVLYDIEKSNWVVADTNKKWYDYDKQKWANAVILNNGVSKNVGDSVDVTTEVVGMFVWIPRYEYKIEGTYGKNGINQSSPGEIEINFISNTIKKTSSSDYHIPNAFTFGSEELSGIWVGKFETTGTEDNPTILPNSESLRNQTVSLQFSTAQKFNNYLTDADSHMMKNSEWGAVAYLSQSKYGKYGNDNYSGVNREIYQNKSSSYYTGNSSGTKETNGTLSQCTYDEIIDRGNGIGSCGGGASTTGNITGIYDMSGGAYENVMALYMKEDTDYDFGATSTGNYAGFTSLIPEKYYDYYINSDILKACSNSICFGHALSETNNWYNSESTFLDVDTPWLVRSSDYNQDFGIFNYKNSLGDASIQNSFRIVLK